MEVKIFCPIWALKWWQGQIPYLPPTR